MKNKKVMRLFAVMLAASLAATSAPQTATIVFAADETESSNVQEGTTEKHQTTLDDFVVKNAVDVYNDDGCFADIWEVKEPLDWSKATLTYRDENGQAVECPKAVGTYKIYVSYQGDDQCSALAETDTGRILTIKKESREESDAGFDVKVVNSKDTGRQTIDLKSDVAWASCGSQSEADAALAVVYVDKDNEKYITDLAYDPQKKSIEFKLTDAAASLDKKSMTIHAYFGDSFSNRELNLEIPLTIANRQEVEIGIQNHDKIYDGSEQKITYTVYGSSEDAGFKTIEGTKENISDLSVTLTREGEPVNEIRDGGSYRIHVVYDNGTYYGEQNAYLWVEPKSLTGEELKNKISFSNVTTSYDGDSKREEIMKTIKIPNDLGICLDDIYFRKQNESENYGAPWEVGTYDVIVLRGESQNYRWDSDVTIGTLTIKKQALTLDNFQINDQQSIVGTNDSLDYDTIGAGLYWDKIHLSCKTEDGKEISPEDKNENGYPKNPGTYKIYVSYDGDDCYEAFPETDTGKKLAVVKDEDFWVESPQVININDIGIYSLDEEPDLKQMKLTDVQISPENQKYIQINKDTLQYNLTSDAKELTDEETIDITVKRESDTCNSTRVYPIVITPKKVADTNVVISDDEELVYDGKAKELWYHVSGDPDSTLNYENAAANQIGNALRVTITKDGKTVGEIVDAGSYEVTAEYEDDNYFGTEKIGFRVQPQQLTEQNIGELLTYAEPGNLTFSPGKNFVETVKSSIKGTDKFSTDDFEIGFKKSGLEDIGWQGEINEPGTYDVIILPVYRDDKTLNYDCEWDDAPSIGQVTVEKYQIQSSDIISESCTETYNGTGWGSWVGYDWDQLDGLYIGYGPVTAYTDENGNPLAKEELDGDGTPINAGIYKVCASYRPCEEDDIAPFDKLDTGETVTIKKAEDNQVLKPYTVKADDNRVQTRDVKKQVKAWTLAGADTDVKAVVSVDGDGTENVDDLKYVDGNIQFRLTDAAKTLTGQKTIWLTVDFGNSFRNYNAKLKLPVQIVGSGAEGGSGTGSGSGSGTESGSGSGSGTGSSSGSGSVSGGGSGSSGGSTSGGNTETKPGTGTETKPEGGKTETTTETKPDGTTVETTTTTDATGAVTSVTEKSVIAQSSPTTSTTVTVKKNGDGAITSAKASISNTITSGNKATISSSIISQITEAAGTKDVSITMTVKKEDGTTKYKVKVDAEDLKAGNKLYIYKLDTKTGKYTMVDAKTYKVSEAGNVAVSMKEKATYELVDSKEAAKIVKEIKKSITPKKSLVSVKKGKNTSFTLSSKADKANIKSITYTTTKKSVATVSKSGKITAKGTGTVTVKAKVALKNGSTKTIKMTVKVK